MTDPTRRLIVMRHAKAGDLPGGPDAERALTPRGMADATRPASGWPGRAPAGRRPRFLRAAGPPDVAAGLGRIH